MNPVAILAGEFMAVDGLLLATGSTNFDSRSFSINDEANINIYAASFARRQLEVFEQDLSHSRRLSLQERHDRPWPDHVIDWRASLLGSQL